MGDSPVTIAEAVATTQSRSSPTEIESRNLIEFLSTNVRSQTLQRHSQPDGGIGKKTLGNPRDFKVGAFRPELNRIPGRLKS